MNGNDKLPNLPSALYGARTIPSMSKLRAMSTAKMKAIIKQAKATAKARTKKKSKPKAKAKAKFGEKKRKHNFKTHLNQMARIVKLKPMKAGSVPTKKSMGALLTRINRRLKTKSGSKYMPKMVAHCSKYYNLKPLKKINSTPAVYNKRWSSFMKKHRNSIRKLKTATTVTKRNLKVVTKKRGKKAVSYQTHGKKGPRKAPKLPVKSLNNNKDSSFGTYWDNTQLGYAPSAASQQPALTGDNANRYPYEGDMVPFYPIGNMFGRKTPRFGMPSAMMDRGMYNNKAQTPLGQGVSRNYCSGGTQQCGSFPRSVSNTFPFTNDY